ncbi:hypothetical protein ACFUGD_01230 [Streptomyces sp. NPDC057217]|uniref:hypothetical protein n=1 Tax=Streptomyces sp. NPDC057217 TaxID=3346054 RepID=UPI003636FD06
MRAYYKPRKAHKICLYLETDEAARLLEEMDAVETSGLMPEFAKARRMLNRAFTELEEDRS